jgi:Nucleotidyltransferase domain
LIPLQQHIIKVLSYFDIFNYPLLADEIAEYLETPAGINEVLQELETLQQRNIVFKLEEFYALKDDIFTAIRRRSGNRMAITHMEKAKKAARLLFQFPFVEGLAISGSLSKNFADENSDIDFFIITKANRLWIARTLMHIFYKWAAVTKRGHLFCMNYYVDEAALEIPEKNIFTAMEIITLVPVQGHQCVGDFMNANKWTTQYIAGSPAKIMAAGSCKKGVWRRITEYVLGGKLGNSIDNRLLALTSRHWQQKKQQAKVNAKGIGAGMLAGKHFAKPDPVHFQHKIIQQYEARLKNFRCSLHPTGSTVIPLSSAVK